MKKLLMIFILALTAMAAAACGGQAASEQPKAAPPAKAEKKILIAYFSYSGTTERVAQDMQAMIGGDLFKIATVQPYPDSYKECTKVAKAEIADNIKPPLKGSVKNIRDYDIIFLGYPIWWHQAPPAVYSFIAGHDLSGKTVIPFCTSGGSQLEDTLPKLRSALAGAKIIEGITVNRPMGVDEWVEKLGLKK